MESKTRPHHASFSGQHKGFEYTEQTVKEKFQSVFLLTILAQIFNVRQK